MTQGANAGLRFIARRKMTLNGVVYESGAEVPLSVIPPEKFEKWRSTRTIIPATPRPRSVVAQSALAMQEAAANGAVAATAAPAAKSEVAAPGPGGIPGGEAIQGEPGSYIQHVGRGWFIVYHEGVEPVKVRGAGPAGDKLRELRGEAGEGKGVSILGGGDGEKAGLAANGVSQDEPGGPGDGASSEGGDAPPLAGENGEAAQMAAMSEAG